MFFRGIVKHTDNKYFAGQEIIGSKVKVVGADDSDSTETFIYDDEHWIEVYSNLWDKLADDDH